MVWSGPDRTSPKAWQPRGPLSQTLIHSKLNLVENILLYFSLSLREKVFLKKVFMGMRCLKKRYRQHNISHGREDSEEPGDHLVTNVTQRRLRPWGEGVDVGHGPEQWPQSCS